jgi:ribonuclease E
LAASIADDLGPTEASEVTEAVADLDTSPEPVAPRHQESPVYAAPKEAAPVVQSQPADEDDKPAPRRSTVREKVSFFFGDSSASANNGAETAAAPVAPSQPEEKTKEESATAPRRAGWWSRRSE